MKIDFKNVIVKDIEGAEETIDMSKELGKILYKSAISKEGLDLARDIYDNGEVELDVETAKAVKQIVINSFLAVIQEALVPELDSIIDQEENELS